MSPDMELGSAGGRPEQPRLPHIIGAGDPAVLRLLAAELARDPEVTVRGHHGSAEEPTLLLTDMTAAHAEVLRRAHPAVTIEVDAPLEPYA
ncbi:MULTISPECIES: hypothetical protein [unclassified Streptomyces]|uniref:hypothetical protein n=1 Tax=unclassified Streptomyces TaxID=2593676 RepID=UPI0028C3FA9B|nr:MULTISPECIES: hypothetical protein [unclassified Streptomyces]WNO71569.1 hypothetical protein RPQ07_07950 [Streptomyces sp. AM8-1-1]